jgi:hypothetical protein
MPSDWKNPYVAGFVNGKDFGIELALRGISTNSQCFTNAVLISEASKNKYFAGVTLLQFTDGLDSFFGDYRNRKIAIADAVWVILSEISGATEKSVKQSRRF